MTQAEINQSVADILDQMAQEMLRVRQGKSLSNLEGIHQSVGRLVKYLRQTEKPSVSDMGGLR